MTDRRPDDMIDAYLAGELPTEHAAQVQAYLEEHPGRRGTVAGFLATARGEDYGLRPSVEASQAEFFARLDRECPTNGQGVADVSPQFARIQYFRRPLTHGNWGTGFGRWSAWYGAGGLLATLLICATWFVFGHRQVRTPSRVATYVTGNGQRATITLPDGNQVLLNVASRLDVPADYERGNRSLQLTGEALFTVGHHEGQPFTVTAGGNTTRVLGTSFAIRHYASDTVSVIAVREGKVVVSSQDRSTAPPLVLATMQAVMIDRLGRASLGPAMPVQFSFADGVLEFNQMALGEAIPALNRWYDADIRLGDPSLAKLHVGGGFKVGSVTDLMGILGQLLDVRVVRDGRIVTLYSRR